MLAAVDVRLPKPQAVVLCPTRDLALQTADVLKRLARFSGIEARAVFPSSPPMKCLPILLLPLLLVTQVAVVIGGVEYGSPIQSHCLVATPLKLQNIIKQGRLLDLSAVRVFALDEVRQHPTAAGLPLSRPPSLPLHARSLSLSPTLPPSLPPFPSPRRHRRA